MSGEAFDRVALIGIGLIGSSLARALRRDSPQTTIIACARRSETLAAVRRLAIADVLKRIRGPFNVTAPALAAGAAAVEDVAALAEARAHNERWLPWFSDRLSALGLELTPSVGNFVLPRFPDEPQHNADAAFAYLQSRGILVRKMGGYGLPRHLRITIGTGEEMETVARVVAEFLGRA